MLYFQEIRLQIL